MRYFIDSHDKILEIVNSNANIECYNFNNRILGKIFCNGDFKYIKHENYDKIISGCWMAIRWDNVVLREIFCPFPK